MADERPSTPPQEAPEGYARPDDFGSFASTTYSLARSGSNMQTLELKCMRDRDVISGDQVRVLHLKHVHGVTLDEAKAAVDGFLKQIEPLGDRDGNGPSGTVFEMFGRVHADMVGPLVGVMDNVHELSSLLTKIDTTASMYPKKSLPESLGDTRLEQSYNPVAELREASDAFYNQVKAIKLKSESYSSQTHTTIKGFGLFRADYDVHKNLIAHMMEKGRNRGVWFHWDEHGYEGSTQRNIGTWVNYSLSLKEDYDTKIQSWEQKIGGRSVRLWYLDDPRYCNMFTLDSQPPWFMENDVRPFMSYTYVMVKGSHGPQKLDLDVRDTDMVLQIQPKDGVCRLLHLYHVRQETSLAAKAAIEGFLDHFESIDDNKRGRLDNGRRRMFSMMCESFDPVHQELLESTKAEIDQRRLRCRWGPGGWPRAMYRECGNQVGYVVSFKPCGLDVDNWNRGVIPGSERVLTGFEQ
ncbi:unnamed protein product [Clonostachys chloroleuca]|uniref:Uncharacterized protein n=1 Tax=Clonostachys chloroleuca TaxID=1926264 RepID=A0AA35Q4M1_9HYPO|nr:unnamed protein product [Clonostachys chloroleuca]